MTVTYVEIVNVSLGGAALKVPGVEKVMVENGIILIKYWLEVSADEQTRRLEGRINDPRKVWKLTDMDLASYTRWDDYTKARDAMLAATDTSWAPWWIASTEDKERGRLNIISHLLGSVPYEPLQAREVKLPKRKVKAADAGAGQPLRYIPTPF